MVKKIYFWTGKWLDGISVDQIAPEVVNLIHPVTKARRTVAEAVPNNKWIEDIKKPISVSSFNQVLEIWEKLRTFSLNLTPKILGFGYGKRMESIRQNQITKRTLQVLQPVIQLKQSGRLGLLSL
jgi:hypothetical protein